MAWPCIALGTRRTLDVGRRSTVSRREIPFINTWS
jgi:hypothetical protein